MSSYLHQILHQDTHVTPPDAHDPQELLAERAIHELLVVNQQQPAHPGKPQEKLGAFVAQTPSTPSGGPRNHVGRHEHGRQEVLRGHEMAALRSRELNQRIDRLGLWDSAATPTLL